MCIFIYMYIFMCVCVCVHVYIYIYAYIYIYISACIHMQSHFEGKPPCFPCKSVHTDNFVIHVAAIPPLHAFTKHTSTT